MYFNSKEEQFSLLFLKIKTRFLYAPPLLWVARTCKKNEMYSNLTRMLQTLARQLLLVSQRNGTFQSVAKTLSAYM